MRDYERINKNTANVWAFLGLAISFFIPVISAEFKGVLGVDPNMIKACFIVLAVIFTICFIVSAIKIINKKLKSKGDEDWFVYHLQDLEQPQKPKHKWSWSFKAIIGKLLKVMYYTLPIVLWIIVVSLIGWDIAWGTSVTSTGETSYTWMATLLLSLGWFVFTYLIKIMCKDSVNDWFDETF